MGCTQKEDSSSLTPVEDATPVRAEHPIRDEVIEVVRAESTLRPRASVQILAEQMGDVRAWNVDVGDEVEKDQVLARIYNDDLDLQIRQAEQTLRAQENELQESRSLLDQGYLPRQAYNELTLVRDQSRTQLKRLRATRADQQIKAPFGGVVLARSIEQGQKVSPGSPLFEIADVSTLYLRIPVPERALRRIHVGQRAAIHLRALDDGRVDAHVAKIHPAVDASTGTILVELQLEASALADGTDLRPGMYARGEIEVERRPDVLMVPRKALVEEGAETYVFVVKKSNQTTNATESGASETPSSPALVVTQRAVQTGWRGDGRVEILRGVEREEQVVTLGQNRLREGSRVRVVEREE